MSRAGGRAAPVPGCARPRLRLGWCHHDAIRPDAPRLPAAGPRRTRDFAAGRQAAAEALAALTGRAPPPVGRRPGGAPEWPCGIVGAISHSDGLAVALVGCAERYAGLGVDLERVVADPAGIAPGVLTAPERVWLDASDPLAVTLAFSAKETLFKALWPVAGCFFGFEAAVLEGLSAQGGRLRLASDLGPWAAGARFGFRWRLTGGRVLTAMAVPRAQARRVAPPSI